MEERIVKKVSYLVKKYQTNDPFKIAAELGIYVSLCPLGNVAGNYRYLEHAKWIFINSDIESNGFKNVVMAHELGHALLHWKENHYLKDLQITLDIIHPQVYNVIR